MDTDTESIVISQYNWTRLQKAEVEANHLRLEVETKVKAIRRLQREIDDLLDYVKHVGRLCPHPKQFRQYRRKAIPGKHHLESSTYKHLIYCELCKQTVNAAEVQNDVTRR